MTTTKRDSGLDAGLYAVRRLYGRSGHDEEAMVALLNTLPHFLDDAEAVLRMVAENKHLGFDLRAAAKTVLG